MNVLLAASVPVLYKACRGQKMLDSLEMELWRLNQGPLEEQTVLFSAESYLQSD